MQVCDLPGFDRIRSFYFDRYKTTARGLIVVVDSIAILRSLKDIAEFLYTTLQDETTYGNKLPILIACNKQDDTFAKSSKVVQSQLEKELNTLRLTRNSRLASSDNAERKDKFLGKSGKDFEFAHLARNKVDFVQCSALEDDDLVDVRDWLNRL